MFGKIVSLQLKLAPRVRCAKACGKMKVIYVAHGSLFFEIEEGKFGGKDVFI